MGGADARSQRCLTPVIKVGCSSDCLMNPKTTFCLRNSSPLVQGLSSMYPNRLQASNLKHTLSATRRLGVPPFRTWSGDQSSSIRQAVSLHFVNNIPMSDEKSNVNRKSIRLPNYDYTQEGAYFVTLVTHNRKCLFGNIVQGGMHLNPIGEVVKDVWLSIPRHFSHVTMDLYVIMPNHIHGILTINSDVVGARHAVPLLQHRPSQNFESFGKPVKGSIPTIIRSFKSEATRRVNIIRGTPGEIFWQRNYFEHVIRDEKDYQAIYNYIIINPHHWVEDDEFSSLNCYRAACALVLHDPF